MPISRTLTPAKSSTDTAAKDQNHLNTLRNKHASALYAHSPLIAPSLPELLPSDEHTTTALLEAIQHHQTEKVFLLVGPRDLSADAAYIKHHLKGQRRIALYHLVLSKYSAFFRSLLSPKELQQQRENLRENMQQLAQTMHCPLTEEELFYLNDGEWIELVDKLSRFDRLPGKESLYLIKNVFPFVQPEDITESFIHAHLQVYEDQRYAKQVKSYFKKHPKEKTFLSLHLVSRHHQRILDKRVSTFAWKCYAQADSKHKAAALRCLDLVLPPLSAPLAATLLANHQGDWALLAMLAQHASPQNHEDFYVHSAIRSYCKNPSPLPEDWDKVAHAFCQTNSLKNFFSPEKLGISPYSHGRSSLLDTMHYFYQTRLSHYQGNSLAMNLNRWYQDILQSPLLLQPEVLLVLQKQTAHRSFGCLAKAWDETASPRRYQAIEETLHCLGRPYSSEKQRHLAYLSLLLGPALAKAETEAAQWFYRPETTLRLQVYWVLLMATQLQYQRYATHDDKAIAWKNVAEYPPTPPQKERLDVFLSLITTGFPEIAVHKMLEKENWLCILEAAYQACWVNVLPEERAFMAYALTLLPQQYTLSTLIYWNMNRERESYKKRVETYFRAYPEDISKVAHIFQLTWDDLSPGAFAEPASIVAHTLAYNTMLCHQLPTHLSSLWMCRSSSENDSPKLPPLEVIIQLIAHGASYIPTDYSYQNTMVDWQILQHFFQIYSPNEPRDELFRQKIVAYSTRIHDIKRWAVLARLLRCSAENIDFVLLQGALEEMKDQRGYSLFPPELISIIKISEKLPISQAATFFPLLNSFLPNLFKDKYRLSLPKKPQFIKEVNNLVLNGRNFSIRPNGVPYANTKLWLENLPYFVNLTCLSCVRMGLNDTGFSLLLAALFGPWHLYRVPLETFNVRGNFLTDKSLQIFAEKYHYCPFLHTLDLRDNLLTNVSAEVLLNALTSGKFPRLRIIHWGKSSLVSHELQEALEKYMQLNNPLFIPSIRLSPIFSNKEMPASFPLLNTGEPSNTVVTHSLTSLSLVSFSSYAPDQNDNKQDELSSSEAPHPVMLNLRPPEVIGPSMKPLYHVLQKKEKEIIFWFGKNETLDSESVLKERILAVAHPKQFPKRHAYFIALCTWLETYLLAHTINQAGLFEHTNNSLQNALQWGDSVPLGGFVVNAIQTIANFMIEQERENFDEQLRHFSSLANKVPRTTGENPVIRAIALLFLTKYVEDYRDDLLTPEQAKMDAARIRDFIGYSNNSQHPVLDYADEEHHDGPVEYLCFRKLDRLMSYCFGSPEVVLYFTPQEWKHYQELNQTTGEIFPDSIYGSDRLSTTVQIDQSGSEHQTETDIEILMYPSEAGEYYDKRFVPQEIIVFETEKEKNEISKKLHDFDKALRKALLNASSLYLLRWECLGFYQQLAVRWFRAHGGYISLKQCKEFEQMAKKLPLEKLLDKLMTFFNYPKNYSGLRKESLYTYFINNFIAEEALLAETKPNSLSSFNFRNTKITLWKTPTIQEREKLCQQVIESARSVQNTLASYK